MKGAVDVLTVHCPRSVDKNGVITFKLGIP